MTGGLKKKHLVLASLADLKSFIEALETNLTSFKEELSTQQQLQTQPWFKTLTTADNKQQLQVKILQLA